jgi:hypothetical protein
MLHAYVMWELDIFRTEAIRCFYTVMIDFILFYFVWFIIICCACRWHCVRLRIWRQYPEGWSRLKLLIHLWYYLCPSKLRS